MTTENLRTGRDSAAAGDGWKISLCIASSARIVPALFQKPALPLMSQHRSLKGQSTIAAKRNVLKRFERVELLTKRGQFKTGDKVMGLRKTKPDA